MRYARGVSLPAEKRATWADLEALPAGTVGELIRGMLHTMPRPRGRHGSASTRIGGKLQGAFQFGDDGGPGGWWIVNEPGIALPLLDVEEIVPDVAGWRRERLPSYPIASPSRRTGCARCCRHRRAAMTSAPSVRSTPRPA